MQLAATADREHNLDRAESLVREAAGAGCRADRAAGDLRRPVRRRPSRTWTTSAGPSRPTGRRTRSSARLSAELGTTILSPIFEASAVTGVYHNSTFAFRSGECVHTYRKSHLPFSNGFPEKFYFRPGAAPPSTFAIDGAIVGTIICYERHFPELGRVLALQGADIMCVPVACASEPTKEVFQLELRAHAAFNSMFVVCANRVGREGTKQYYGLSAIYGPDGTVLAQLGDDEGVVVAEIDLAIVEQRRRVLPFFRDRRPDLYGALSGDGGMMTIADIDAAAPTAGAVRAAATPPAPSRLRERVGKVGFALRTTLTGVALLVVLAALWEGYKAFGQHYDDHFFNTSWELPVATDDLAMPHVRDIVGALFEPVAARQRPAADHVAAQLGAAARWSPPPPGWRSPSSSASGSPCCCSASPRCAGV